MIKKIKRTAIIGISALVIIFLSTMIYLVISNINLNKKIDTILEKIDEYSIAIE